GRGLKSNDHLVRWLQTRAQPAPIHWACQFAGLIITPLNWRASADELDFCATDAEAKAIVYEAVSAEAVQGSRAAQARLRIAVALPGSRDIAFAALAAPGTRPPPPRVDH